MAALRCLDLRLVAVAYRRMHTAVQDVHLISKINTEPGWVSYLGEDAFYTNFSTTASLFVSLLSTSAWLFC